MSLSVTSDLSQQSQPGPLLLGCLVGWGGRQAARLLHTFGWTGFSLQESKGGQTWACAGECTAGLGRLSDSRQVHWGSLHLSTQTPGQVTDPDCQEKLITPVLAN